MTDGTGKTRALYEQAILDHNKNPCNFRAMADASCKAEGYNPLCGDEFTVYLRLEDDHIVDVSFEGCGCAISKSSASVMTTMLKGKTRQQAEYLFVDFHQMVAAEPGTPFEAAKLGKLAVFAGVREYPVRLKCATLPWHTLSAVPLTLLAIM